MILGLRWRVSENKSAAYEELLDRAGRGGASGAWDFRAPGSDGVASRSGRAQWSRGLVVEALVTRGGVRTCSPDVMRDVVVPHHP